MLFLVGFSACLDSKEAETITTNYDNAIVTSFSLEANSDVCANLSSYSFTIDNFGFSDDSIHRLFPEDGIIFNPDSLPVGSIADSVKVSLTTSSPRSVSFDQYEADGTLGRHSDFSKDSAIFFASYPDCRLVVESFGGTKKTYHIKVNVHKVKADTIAWHDFTSDLWADMNITDQRVDTLRQTFYWFVEDVNGRNHVSSALVSAPKVWQPMAEVTVPDGDLLDLSTLYNFHGSLYAVGKNHKKLLTSTDGYHWAIANDAITFQSILGTQLSTKDVYGDWNQDSLNAIVKVNGEYHFAVSADARQWNVEQKIQSNFPIRGFSRPVLTAARSNYGNLTSRIYIVGGELADGTMTSCTWSCDGWSDNDKGPNWEEFAQDELPAMSGASVLEYTLNADSPKSFWILYPGFKADGSLPTNRLYGKNYPTLYYSQDSGVSWHRLSRYYTQYADVTPVGAVACNSAFCDPATFQMYFFGGKRTDGSFKTAVWGGVLNSLTFDKVR